MKKGRLSKDEQAYIKANISQEVEEVAAHLNRSVAAVKKYMDKMSVAEKVQEVVPISLAKIKALQEEEKQPEVTNTSPMPTYGRRKKEDFRMKRAEGSSRINKVRVPINAGGNLNFKNDPNAQRFKEDDPEGKSRAMRADPVDMTIHEVPCASEGCRAIIEIPAYQLMGTREITADNRCERCCRRR